MNSLFHLELSASDRLLADGEIEHMCDEIDAVARRYGFYLQRAYPEVPTVAEAAKPNAPEQQKDFDPKLRVVASDLVADMANGRNLSPVIADENPLAKVEFEPVTFRHGETFTVTSTASVS